MYSRALKNQNLFNNIKTIKPTSADLSIVKRALSTHTKLRINTN